MIESKTMVMRAVKPGGPIGRAVSTVSAAALVGLLIWTLLWHWQAFLAWKAQAGFWPFFIGLALLPLLGIPTTPLFVLAGATFDLATALIGCALAVAANLALSYWLARRWLRDWLAYLLARCEYELPNVSGQNTLAVLVLVRLTPGLPATLKNYLVALIDVPFSTYFAVSWVITLLYAVGLIVLGDSLSNASLVEAAVAVALLAAVSAGALWFFKYQQKRRTPRGRNLAPGDAKELL